MTKKVIVYSTKICPYCHMVKDYLKEKGVAFVDIDVTADQARQKEMIDKSGQMGVPVIDIDEKIVVGFDKTKIDQLIE